MGKPKFSRKKYETPNRPWEENRIKSENELIKKYGLKNKREIWKAQTILRKYRGQARELLAKIGTDTQSKKESDQLLMHLNRMNILPANATLDDVLTLETESILSRRLQTISYLKGLANTPNQARQLISHGHIAIDKNRVTIPSYMVNKDEEGDIGFTTDSPLNDITHPARPKAEYQKRSPKKEEQIEKPKEEPKQEIPKEKTTEEPGKKDKDEKQDIKPEAIKEEKQEKTDEKNKESTKKSNNDVKKGDN